MLRANRALTRMEQRLEVAMLDAWNGAAEFRTVSRNRALRAVKALKERSLTIGLATWRYGWRTMRQLLEERATKEARAMAAVQGMQGWRGSGAMRAWICNAQEISQAKARVRRGLAGAVTAGLMAGWQQMRACAREWRQLKMHMQQAGTVFRHSGLGSSIMLWRGVAGNDSVCSSHYNIT